MKMLPTLDDQEHGHTAESAYVAGDVDALAALDAEVLDWARELAEDAHAR